MTEEIQQEEQDLFERANNPQDLVFQYWGQLNLRPWMCALVKGIGKVPYDPQVHKKKTLAMEMFIEPIPESQVSFEIKREPVEFSNEYKMFLQSVWDAGMEQIVNANGAWCRASYQPTGETYTKSVKIGEGQYKEIEKPKTYLCIEMFFENEEKCREDFFEIMGEVDPDNGDVPFLNEEQETSINAASSAPDFEGMKDFLHLAIAKAQENTEETLIYEEIVGWFEQPQFAALKSIYGQNVPGAKEFVEKVLAEEVYN